MSWLRFLQPIAFGTVCFFGAHGAEAAGAPSFSYDAQTGVVRMHAELDPGTTLVSWLIEGPQASGILAFQDGTNSQGSDWVQGYFDGKEQWIALTGDGVSGSWDVALYPASLDLSVFGQVEYGLRFSGGGGATGFASMTAPPTLPGDLDGDGFVGISDLNLVLGNWNMNVPPANPLADPSGDSFVGIDDLNEVLGNWNTGTPPTAAFAVPEPAVACLVLTWIPFVRRFKTTELCA